MKKYSDRKNDIALHCISFVLIHFALLGITVVHNGFIFLLFWELMALTSFILVIFEREKPDTIKAGINYLIQSHISIVFLMLGFIYLAYKTGSYDFNAIIVLDNIKVIYFMVFLLISVHLNKLIDSDL